MFRIFLITIVGIFFAQTAVAAQKSLQSLEEINAELLAKKAAMEPFDQKKVKVDLESLGLDDLDKKVSEKKVDEVKSNPVAQQVDQKMVEPNKEAPTKVDGRLEVVPVGISPASNPIVVTAPSGGSLPLPAADPSTKIQNLLDKSQAEGVTNKKNSTEKYINSVKKRNLKKRLEAEKQKKINEKKRQEKLKKLHDLRRKYLIKIDTNSAQRGDDLSEDDSEDGSSDKIIPRKKDIHRFISDESPAMPILNRFRTSDNLHIPAILTAAERIDILFNAISQGNVAFFNSAYKDVGNSNTKNQIGDTILTYSVLLQKESIIASVLAKGADPNMPNNLGYTPIDIAIEMLDMKALQLLIDNKADPKYLDGFGRTYLMHAARVGFLPAVELFVAQGVEVNAMDNDGFTALSIAYRHKKEIIIAYLLKHGAKTWIEKPYDPGNQSLIKELENRWQ